MVKKRFVAAPHGFHVGGGLVIADAVPFRAAIFDEAVPCVDRGLGLKEPEGHLIAFHA